MIGRATCAAAALLAMLALVGGCAAPRADETAPAPAALSAPAPAAQSPDRAVRVADALLLAAQAETAQDDATLAQAAFRLERLGASPQSDEDVAALQRWYAGLPAGMPPMRGRALGPAYRSQALEPGGTAQLHQTFLGGRSAQIVVRVARGSAPRLVVRDQADRQVCAIDGAAGECRFVPRYTQRHRIEIVNTGPAMSKFFVVFD